MSLEDAILLAEKEGARTPEFFGEVVIRIKAGGVSGVDVKRTFIGQ